MNEKYIKRIGSSRRKKKKDNLFELIAVEKECTIKIKIELEVAER